MRFWVLIVTILFAVSAYGQECANNEIQNAGFESGGTGWGVLVPAPPNIFNPPQPEISNDAFTGSNAAIACGPEMVVAYVTPFQNESNRTYVVSACAKIEGNPTKVGFGAVYLTFSGALTGFDTISVMSQEYVCLTKTFVPPPNQIFGIGFALEGGGPDDKIYIDDFCVEIFDSCDVGSSCDDGDANTVDDQINDFCACKGTTCEGVFANAGLDQSILPGDAVTLTASGGTSYIWNTGEMTQSITVSPSETTTYTVCVSNGNTSCEDCDDVTVSIIETYDIGNGVWNDLNRNGCRDAGEPGMNNISIELYDALFDVRLRTSTSTTINGEEGVYSFDDWVPGNYYLKIKDLPDTLCITSQDGCADDRDSDFDENTGETNTYLISGDTDHIDLGVFRKTALPLTFSRFEVYRRANINHLSWQVQIGAPIDYFVVERRIGNSDEFTQIKTISPQQNNIYNLEDSNAPAGTVYYRIGVYEDGLISYSEIRSITSTFTDPWSAQISPNVITSDALPLSISGLPEQSNVSISIIGTSGNTISRDALQSSSAAINKVYDISKLKVGLYYVIITVGTSSKTLKFIKTK